MTADKYQQPHHCPLEKRVMGIESDVSAVKRMVTGMYDRVGELAETADAIHDIVRCAGEPKYNHADEWDMATEDE